MAADGTGLLEINDEQRTEIIYRRPRIFISHVWGRHDQFAERIKALLNERFTPVDDLSVYEEEPDPDANYNALENLLLKSKMAARIFASDIVFASMDSSVSHSKWVRNELELASIAYTKPILLVDEDHLKQRTSLRSEISEVNARCAEVNLDRPEDFVRAVKRFVPEHVPDAGDLFASFSQTASKPAYGLRVLKHQIDALQLRPSPEHEKQEQNRAERKQAERYCRRRRRASRMRR